MIYFHFVIILVALNHFGDAHLLQNYEWHPNVSAKNAQLFNDFMAKMYSVYTQQLENQFLAEHRKRRGFFGTFAKFATELANAFLILAADGMFDFDFFNWKVDLEVLFTAFKVLSADQNTATNTDLGIFPFRFVSTNNYWEISVPEIGERIQQNVHSVDYYSTEQMQYIENFKFVLQLSKYSLTPFEVHQILKKIQNETIISQNDQSQQPAEVYTFLKEFLLPKIGDDLPKCGQISCILVHFGRHLFRQVDFFNSADTWHMEYEKTRNFFFENCNTICSSSSPMCRYKWDLELFVKNVPKFGQVLFETMHQASKSGNICWVDCTLWFKCA
ncbi:hypothetical protein niasHT_011131 [Heterodera trifolii]|uniref:Uncharacterized protein n=1 Tax=Heterodera trifolii TaxID=157864 RepID=A0ABD2L9N7_9BILA